MPEGSETIKHSNGVTKEANVRKRPSAEVCNF